MATFCDICLFWFETDDDYKGHRHQPSRLEGEIWYDARTGSRMGPSMREQGTGNSPPSTEWPESSGRPRRSVTK